MIKVKIKIDGKDAKMYSEGDADTHEIMKVVAILDTLKLRFLNILDQEGILDVDDLVVSEEDIEG